MTKKAASATVTPRASLSFEEALLERLKADRTTVFSLEQYNALLEITTNGYDGRLFFYGPSHFV